MADGDLVTAATEPPGDPIVRVGRYVLGRALGASARGDRHAAIDPRDDRRVAIARLHHDLAAADAAALRALAHPDIVPILDAGSAGGRGYVVTAVVDGAPIDRWAHGRRAARIVAAFRAAGRGLAAAHAAGVVHGDVTAADLVVDGDGIARITGFVAAAPPDASAAADQRAFATALHDALAAAGVAAVPRRVRAALDRARASDPAARFPSLAALVDAIAPSRRGVALAIGAVALAAVTAAIAWPTGAAPVAGAAPPVGPPRADLRAEYPLTTEPGNCSSDPIVLDNDTVIYDRTDGADVDVYGIALPDGEPRPVARGEPWAWRANRGLYPGEAMYLITDPTRRARSRIALVFFRPHGTSTTMLPDPPSAPVYDAAGFKHTVLYAADDGIHQLDDRGDRRYRQMSDQRVESLAISHDDRWLATTGVRADGTSVVCAIDTQTGKLDCIDHDRVASGRPAFGRAGPWLYFSDADGVWWHDLRTGETAPIERTKSAPGGIAVTADGRALVLSRCAPHRRIVDAGTWPPAVVVEDAYAPSLANDDTLAYLVDRDGAVALFVRSPDRRVVALGVPGLRAGEAPALDPDGTRVAYAGAGGIGVIGTAGAMPARRTAGDDRAPHWIDDDRVVFTRGDGSAAGVYVVSATAGDAVLVAEHAAALAARRGEVLVVHGDGTAWRALATGRERATGLPAGVVEAAVSPSGRWLAYATGDQHVWRVDLDAGSPAELIIAVPPTRLVAHFAIGDDGRVLIAPVLWQGDLVVVPAAAGSRF